METLAITYMILGPVIYLFVKWKKVNGPIKLKIKHNAKIIMKTMNQTHGLLGFLLIGILLTSSCNQEEREKLSAEAAQLEQQLHRRDSAFNAIMSVMTEVESQIEAIKVQEHLITTKNGEFPDLGKVQLVDDMKKINGLIDNTNEKMVILSRKLDGADMELKAFKNRINSLSESLQEREQSIVKLEEELVKKDHQIAELNTEVGTLVTRVQLQKETIEIQNEELVHRENALNRAYFAIDTEKNLKEGGLVTKEGGFLWIGKSTELQENVAQDKFTEVDIQNTKRFYIDSDKLEIITEHPSKSYKLVTDADKVKYLEVTDPREFWKISKYLVVSVKG